MFEANLCGLCICSKCGNECDCKKVCIPFRPMEYCLSYKEREEK